MPWPGTPVILAFVLLLYPYLHILTQFFVIHIKYVYI